MFAQSDFTLRWSSEVGCLTYGEDREKELPLEDIENDKCVKVCEGSTVMFELMFDNQTQQVDDITWNVDGGNITNTSPDQTQINVQWPTALENASINVEILMSNGETILSRLCVEVTPKPEAFFEIAGLENEFNCTVTSPDLDLQVIACRENCNIDMFVDDIRRTEEGSFINYSLQGGFINANNLPITITLNSNNGVFIPSVFSIPANSSISFGSGNPLIFIPDANFTGGVDVINIEGQDAGLSFCLQEMTIEYPMLQTRARAELKATPNAVEHTTTLSYELTHIKNLGQANIEVYNMLGYVMDKRVLKQTDGTLNLNMSAYTSGKYIVVLKHNGQILTQLILIKE